MIINNARSCCDVDFWTKHLGNTEANERAELKEVRGLKADNLAEALNEMQGLARDHPRTKNFMYHADFNPRRDEHLTPEQRDRAFEMFEKERGIPPDAARIVMEHAKEGRQHWHVMWYRLDDNGRPFSDSLDADVAHRAAAKISWELGLEIVISPLTREPGTPRPPRAPKPWEMYRGDKSGLDPREVAADITGLLQLCENDGKGFSQALETRGYILARGDKIVAGEPALMIIDLAGNDHHLPRRIDGMKAAKVNELMQHIDRASLPNIQQAKDIYQDRKIAALEADHATVRHEIEREEALTNAAIEKEKIEERLLAKEDSEKGTRAGGKQHETQQQPARPRFGDVLLSRAAEAAMRDPRQQHGEPLSNGAAFRDALEKNRLGFACVTPEEAAKSHREAEFAKAVERYAPEYQAGEIVIVREQPKAATAGRVHKLDQTKAEDYLRCLAIDKNQLQGIEATKQTLDDRAQMRQRAIDAAEQRKARGPQRGGLVQQQTWAMQRVREAEQQRQREQEYRQREYAEKQKRDSSELDPERYRMDPEYRRQVQNTQSWKSPEDKQRDRENDLRTLMEQQDRGR